MLNIKRAFETMNKEGSGTSSYYSSYYRLSNSNVLVSNGRVIVTVSDALFEENKEAVYFSSNKELLEKCLYYLENEEIRSKIKRERN